MSIPAVRISQELASAAKTQADIFHRSLPAQIEYWARIGRAVEASPEFTVERLGSLLSGVENGHIDHWPVARAEAAVEVIGMKIAALTEELWTQRRAKDSDALRIAAILQEQGELHRVQETISPSEVTLVAAILSQGMDWNGHRNIG